jgi:hypothetical protein
MNLEALIIFLILLLGLALCSFLGSKEGFAGTFSGKFETIEETTDGNSEEKDKSETKHGDYSKKTNGRNYDNYNHYTKSSNRLTNGTTFYGNNGGKIIVSTDTNGSRVLKVTLSKDQTPMLFTASTYGRAAEGFNTYESDDEHDASKKTFYGPNGSSANVISDDGQTEIQINTGSGAYVYTLPGSYHNPDSTTSTQYYGSTGYTVQPSEYSIAYQGPYGGSATVTASKNTSTSKGSSNSGNNSAYFSSMPTGIPKSQIPPGQEDMYILKSEIVPPVCPICPVSQASCPRQEKCPPCPACARCPEPAFECKKVPNYNAINNEYLPAPVVNDFSQFGM